MRKANNILQDVYNKSRLADAMITPRYIIRAYVMAFALLLTYFILNFVNPDLYYWFDLLEFTVLFLACLTVIIVTVMNYRRGGVAFVDFRNFAKK